MIRLLSSSINLGLRPFGLYETVDLLTSKPSFHPTDPGGEPLDILINPLDTPFLSRPRSFLTSLRDARSSEKANALKKKNQNRKSSNPENSNDATKRTTSRRSTSVATDAALLSSGIDPIVAERLRSLLSSPRSGGK